MKGGRKSKTRLSIRRVGAPMLFCFFGHMPPGNGGSGGEFADSSAPGRARKFLPGGHCHGPWGCRERAWTLCQHNPLGRKVRASASPPGWPLGLCLGRSPKRRGTHGPASGPHRAGSGANIDIHKQNLVIYAGGHAHTSVVYHGVNAHWHWTYARACYTRADVYIIMHTRVCLRPGMRSTPARPADGGGRC